MLCLKIMKNKQEKFFPKRGEVYLINFDPTIGSEIKKTRPALIIQNDVSNKYSPVTIVAAISSQFDGIFYPNEVLIKSPEGGLNVDSVALLNQIRTIDCQRLIKKIGHVSNSTIQKIDIAMKISLGLIEF